jgi:hypothetical protein
MQLTARYKVATPVNWKQGEDVIIVPAVADPEAMEKFPEGWKTVKPYLRIVKQPGVQRNVVHYKKAGIAFFDAPVEKIFEYMSAGNHQHAAFKRHSLLGISGNAVTLDAEIFNPDGSTFKTTITHTLNPPKGVETRMAGGAFDGARFVHSYTPVSGGTKVDLEGDFPAFPGMPETDEIKMIDGFFAQVFAEDTATLRKWS